MSAKTSFPRPLRRGQRGSAVIIVLVFLVIMVLFVGVNTAALQRLRRDVKQVEKQQIERIAPSANQPPTARSATKRPLSR
jgi:Tfp pilus assembly protein PilX